MKIARFDADRIGIVQDDAIIDVDGSGRRMSR